MSDGTKIEWADATVNAVNGCSLASPGCTNCYAMKLAGGRMQNHPTRAGLTAPSKAGPVWTGEVRLHEPALLQPLRWSRPRRIFWNAHGDLFHENVPDEWIDRVFASCALTPQHTHMILTKRSARMRAYMTGLTVTRLIAATSGLPGRPQPLPSWPLPNVWLGVSVEDQVRANERIPDLLQTPAAIRFISAEPLLGPVDLTWIEFPNERGGTECWDALDLHAIEGEPLPEGEGEATLDWVIVGGESGPGSRPMHPDWATSLRDQCATAGVAFHFKQWGDWAPVKATDDAEAMSPACRSSRGSKSHLQGGVRMGHVGKKAAGRLLDGVEHNGLPA